jgi:hypothetical protein
VDHGHLAARGRHERGGPEDLPPLRHGTLSRVAIPFRARGGAGIVDFSDEMRSKKERRKRAKVDAAEMNRYRVLVDMLESDLETFQLGDPQNYRAHYNPLVPWAKLLGGIIAALVSALWVIQIIVYQLFNPPLYAFLNIYFAWFDGWFPLFGTLSIALFGLYLLLAAAKGAFKFGTRFFLIKASRSGRGDGEWPGMQAWTGPSQTALLLC